LRASKLAKRIAGVQAKLQKGEHPRLKQTSKGKYPKAIIEKQSGKSKVRIPVRAEG
jgi:hypothetical protein